MIKNQNKVVANVATIITTRISQINIVYRGGPSLHFYHRILALRRQHSSVSAFLSSDTCIEILYATLVSWDMNSRGAKLKDYADFKSNLVSNIPAFQSVETVSTTFTWLNRLKLLASLSTLYDRLALMKSDGRLVSNSKCIHYVFPALCLPMDGKNTLQKLYGNTGESKNKFIEILNLSYDVLVSVSNPQQYLDKQWNTSEMKLVDNAILMM
jgi:hypothetical protein